MENLKRNLTYIGAGILCFVVIFNSFIFITHGADAGTKYMESFKEVFKIIAAIFGGL